MWLDFFPIATVNDTKDMFTIFRFISSDGVTDGLFFPIMLLVIWGIQFIGVISEGRQASRGWIFASFTATILGIILGILALLERKWIYLLILFVSFGVFWIKLQNSKTP